MFTKINFISKIDFRFVAIVVLLTLFVLGAGAPGATGV